MADKSITPEQYAARVERAARRAWSVLLDVTQQDDQQLRELALNRLSNGTLQGLRDIVPVAVQQCRDLHPRTVE